MQEITHCINERPIYDTDSGEVLEWENPRRISGKCKDNRKYTYHPVVMDIETSAELGQRPILCVAYDSLENTVIILVKWGYEGYELSKEKAENMISNFNADRVVIENISITNFENLILQKIAKWNKKAKKRNSKDRKSLVCHNAEFDIPMMGKPNDELLDNDKIGSQYEQSVTYKDICMVGHRAGQFGNIFTFLDSSRNFTNLNIPVGDTLVGCKSLWIAGTLEKACEKMNVDIEVSKAENHGTLTNKYVEYCINDVYATYKLYRKLQNRINKMFGDLPLEHIYSTASIGKFVLREMGYKRPGYSQDAVDNIVPAYFGGRTEAKVTGEIIENLRYTDILSQYPTVSKLTGVWDFMKCETVDIKHIDPKELPEIKDLKNPENWKEISNYYVKIKPNGATLPVRTPHLEDTTKVINSKVHSDKDLQYHYMDILSAKLIDNEEKFEIVSAWKVTKDGKQDLDSFKIGNVELEPSDNIMAKSIEARKELKHKEGKSSKTKSLKIVANSMYGISAERIVKEKEQFETQKHDYATNGGYYNPHVAATITAGGRLMLALGERTAKENGGELIYCDTDSLIIPDHCTSAVLEAFNKLNPYNGYTGNLQVLEDEKEQKGNLYAVGTKKYVFFNDNGDILEYKEHGLGNYDNLREKEDQPNIIKKLWATILFYDKGENPLNVELLNETKIQEPVNWSFTASTRSMREMVEEFTQDTIKYGDWIQSTISFDNEVRYMALNLEEKQDKDKILKAEMNGEKVKSVEQIEKLEMLQSNKLKTTEDIIYKFIQETAKSDSKPTVEVTNLKTVTKEATNRKDIFVTKLQEKFRNNMEMAIKTLFG